MAQVDGEVAPRDPNVLIKEIESTRQDLARTIDALAERVSPGHLAQEARKRFQGEVSQARKRVQGEVSQARERVRGEASRPQVRMVGAAVAVAAVALVAFALWRRNK
jgi:Protein of unknown function (DUF3618)